MSQNFTMRKIKAYTRKIVKQRRKVKNLKNKKQQKIVKKLKKTHLNDGFVQKSIEVHINGVDRAQKVKIFKISKSCPKTSQ